MLKYNWSWDRVWFGDKSFKGWDTFSSGRGAATCSAGKSPNLFSTFLPWLFCSRFFILSFFIVFATRFTWFIIGFCLCSFTLLFFKISFQSTFSFPCPLGKSIWNFISFFCIFSINFLPALSLSTASVITLKFFSCSK